MPGHQEQPSSEEADRIWFGKDRTGGTTGAVMEVGIEGQFDDERLRHRNTGAKMVMDGCSNGDRVDEVRVGHVRHVDHVGV